MKRKGFDIAHCAAARQMRGMGLEGVIRGELVKTTISEKAAPYPFNKINRQFPAPAPNRLADEQDGPCELHLRCS